MPRIIIILFCTSAVLSACQPAATGPDTGIEGLPGGLAPAHGRTPEERAAANAYYYGPRGDEF
ncbi:hypothetical protein [Ruegeria sediminis]|uniref:hypothetical protein n=1 Tax=Ruegeria sediminis TaxID=2583820 RepID=UPI001485FAD7|nr:hypothetical protein [Ruegeria sediminis]